MIFFQTAQQDQALSQFLAAWAGFFESNVQSFTATQPIKDSDEAP
jgi:hypothetical protein